MKPPDQNVVKRVSRYLVLVGKGRSDLKLGTIEEETRLIDSVS